MIRQATSFLTMLRGKFENMEIKKDVSKQNVNKFGFYH